jgi:hypothetical protein
MLFNCLGVVMFIPLVPLAEKLINRLIKEKEQKTIARQSQLVTPDQQSIV